MILFDRRVYPSSAWNSLPIIKCLLDQEKKKGLYEVRLKGADLKPAKQIIKRCQAKQAAFGVGPLLIAIVSALFVKRLLIP